MWFDASAALAELGRGPDPKAKPTATPATIATERIRVADVADVAAHPKRLALNKWGSRPAHLPSAPSVCAICGDADWTVSLTNADGRKMHVACSKSQTSDRTPDGK